MVQKTCPFCGTSVGSSRTTCPACRRVFHEKNSMVTYLYIALLTVIAIVVIAVVLLNSPAQPGMIQNTPVALPPTIAAASAPSAPPCTIAITGSRTPPTSIHLQVMTTTCSAGDISSLRVLVNGAQKGSLGTNPGASGTFTGTSGTNNVVVVVAFTSGAENVVYQNPAL
jgi:hypothetical protein